MQMLIVGFILFIQPLTEKFTIACKYEVFETRERQGALLQNTVGYNSLVATSR